MEGGQGGERGAALTFPLGRAPLSHLTIAMPAGGVLPDRKLQDNAKASAEEVLCLRNLVLLGLDGVTAAKDYGSVVIGPGMFKQANFKGLDCVLHFLYRTLNGADNAAKACALCSAACCCACPIFVLDRSCAACGLCKMRSSSSATIGRCAMAAQPP